eukprot:bmy_19417T0
MATGLPTEFCLLLPATVPSLHGRGGGRDGGGLLLLRSRGLDHLVVNRRVGTLLEGRRWLRPACEQDGQEGVREQPGRGPVREGPAREEPTGPVAVPESGAEGGGRGLPGLLARRALISRRGRGLQRAACPLTPHAVSARCTQALGQPGPSSLCAASPSQPCPVSTKRVGRGQPRGEVSCQEGPRCHTKAHLHRAGAGSREGPGLPAQSPGHTHPAAGPRSPLGWGFSYSGPGAGGWCRMGLVPAGPRQGCAGCGISLTAAGPVCGAASRGLLTGRGQTLAGPRPEAAFRAEACGILLSAARTSTTPGALLAVAWPGVSHGAGAGVPCPSCPLPVPWASPVCSGGGAGGGGRPGRGGRPWGETGSGRGRSWGCLCRPWGGLGGGLSRGCCLLPRPQQSCPQGPRTPAVPPLASLLSSGGGRPRDRDGPPHLTVASGAWTGAQQPEAAALYSPSQRLPLDWLPPWRRLAASGVGLGEVVGWTPVPGPQHRVARRGGEDGCRRRGPGSSVGVCGQAGPLSRARPLPGGPGRSLVGRACPGPLPSPPLPVVPWGECTAREGLLSPRPQRLGRVGGAASVPGPPGSLLGGPAGGLTPGSKDGAGVGERAPGVSGEAPLEGAGSAGERPQSRGGRVQRGHCSERAFLLPPCTCWPQDRLHLPLSPLRPPCSHGVLRCFSPVLDFHPRPSREHSRQVVFPPPVAASDHVPCTEVGPAAPSPGHPRSQRSSVQATSGPYTPGKQHRPCCTHGSGGSRHHGCVPAWAHAAERAPFGAGSLTTRGGGGTKAQGVTERMGGAVWGRECEWSVGEEAGVVHQAAPSRSGGCVCRLVWTLGSEEPREAATSW